MHPADLPDTVSVFPLPGALLLPRSRLPLHIFEPRYLQMLDDALKTKERLIGMDWKRSKMPSGGCPRFLNAISWAGNMTTLSVLRLPAPLTTSAYIARQLPVCRGWRAFSHLSHLEPSNRGPACPFNRQREFY